MEALRIEETEDTPRIVLDPENNEFSVSGRSLPEDSVAFYTPVFEWLQQYTEVVENDMDFVFFMEYFNTSSAKQIAKIFLLLEKINEKVFVQVIWKCKKDDVDMASSGMRFSKLLNLEFEVREEE
ncbi:MAG: DUF1987 domain-containing protein [Bacteroidales bacterium]|jgi:hypothetical protein|nr:DUF1987 domain-containing protein [Bacteroidales bacterium]MBO7124915.1 DUF1987 domain-containing protein [Bacteroidales bacterium]